MTTQLIEYLTNHMVPFNTSLKADNIIIIPMNSEGTGIIKVKNYMTLRNEADVHHFIHQIKTLNYYHIYILLENIVPETFEAFTYMFYSKIDINRVTLCSTYEQIIINEWSYAIRSTGQLFTLVSMFSTYYPIIKNIIHITISTYNHSIICMTDEEVAMLNKYNLNFVEEIISMPNVCYITKNTFKEKELFTFPMNSVPLIGGTRKPCRVIDGITMFCPSCGNIVFVDSTPEGYVVRKHKLCFIK